MTQATEYSEQNNSINKATLVAFVIMMITLLLSLVQIISTSNLDMEVTAKVYSSSVNSNNLQQSLQNESSDEMQAPMEDDPININTATLELLMQLNGIGDAKAAAIIEYREQNGGFNKIEDIMNVKGIGERIFAAIKDSIKV